MPPPLPFCRHPPRAQGCPPAPGERAGCGSGEGGRIRSPFCRRRVIYDMREGHCLDPSCIFPRALPLFPDPRCAPATVPLLWDVLPAPRLCGAVPGRAARLGRTHLEPRAPLPAAQPLGGPADVPRAWEWGFRPLQVHGHRRHSAAGEGRRGGVGGEGEGGGGQRDLGRLAPFSPSLSAPAVSSVHTDPPSLSPPDKCAHK